MSTSVFSKPLAPKLIQVNPDEVDYILHENMSEKKTRFKKVSLTSAVIKWEEPSRIAAGSTITHYVLRYSAWNENGTEAFSGTEGELIITDATEVQIDQLSEGATYDFTVKVRSY